ncbi:amino acid racemase [Neisseria leonii]|uniref:aspartate/glutamate racemase family protein n=1 Tax=Neisseria leonii TaxID=2995413 RepID=UPI0030CA8D45
MKKIGLVGGLSWLSTAEYYRRLNQLARQVRGGHHTVDIVLESLDEGAFLAAQAGGNGEEACLRLVSAAVGRLRRSGAEIIAFCANGIHRFADAVAAEHGIRPLSIAGAAAQYAADRAWSDVGVIGVAKTMQGTFYPAALAQAGLRCTVPQAQEQEQIHRAIVEEMVLGVFSDRSRDMLAGIIRRMDTRAVVLACTELPLLFALGDETESDLGGTVLISSTEVHCRSIIRAAAGSPDAV